MFFVQEFELAQHSHGNRIEVFPELLPPNSKGSSGEVEASMDHLYWVFPMIGQQEGWQNPNQYWPEIQSR
jgi:hypothetical protein